MTYTIDWSLKQDFGGGESSLTAIAPDGTEFLIEDPDGVLPPGFLRVMFELVISGYTDGFSIEVDENGDYMTFELEQVIIASYDTSGGSTEGDTTVGINVNYGFDIVPVGDYDVDEAGASGFVAALDQLDALLADIANEPDGSDDGTTDKTPSTGPEIEILSWSWGATSGSTPGGFDVDLTAETDGGTKVVMDYDEVDGAGIPLSHLVALDALIDLDTLAFHPSIHGGLDPVDVETIEISRQPFSANLDEYIWSIEMAAAPTADGSVVSSGLSFSESLASGTGPIVPQDLAEILLAETGAGADLEASFL